jgi:hypothetical protein
MSDYVGDWSTTTEVQNIQGTSKKRYKIHNLKQLYKQMTGSNRETCAAVGCSNAYQATAHVLVNDGSKGGGSGQWYGVPTCNAHNSYARHPTFEILANVRLIRISDTWE